jgi:hypothetical protein
MKNTRGCVCVKHLIYILYGQEMIAPGRRHCSHLGVSASSMCNVVRYCFVTHCFTTCFDLNDHLQVYSLFYFSTLLLTVMRVLSLVVMPLVVWLCEFHVVVFGFIRGCFWFYSVCWLWLPCECSFWAGSSAVGCQPSWTLLF